MCKDRPTEEKENKEVRHMLLKYAHSQYHHHRVFFSVYLLDVIFMLDALMFQHRAVSPNSSRASPRAAQLLNFEADPRSILI